MDVNSWLYCTSVVCACLLFVSAQADDPLMTWRVTTDSGHSGNIVRRFNNKTFTQLTDCMCGSQTESCNIYAPLSGNVTLVETRNGAPNGNLQQTLSSLYNCEFISPQPYVNIISCSRLNTTQCVYVDSCWSFKALNNRHMCSTELLQPRLTWNISQKLEILSYDASKITLSSCDLHCHVSHEHNLLFWLNSLAHGGLSPPSSPVLCPEDCAMHLIFPNGFSSIPPSTSTTTTTTKKTTEFFQTTKTSSVNENGNKTFDSDGRDFHHNHDFYHNNGDESHDENNKTAIIVPLVISVVACVAIITVGVVILKRRSSSFKMHRNEEQLRDFGHSLTVLPSAHDLRMWETNRNSSFLNGDVLQNGNGCVAETPFRGFSLYGYTNKNNKEDQEETSGAHAIRNGSLQNGNIPAGKGGATSLEMLAKNSVNRKSNGSSKSTYQGQPSESDETDETPRYTNMETLNCAFSNMAYENVDVPTGGHPRNADTKSQGKRKQKLGNNDNYEEPVLRPRPVKSGTGPDQDLSAAKSKPTTSSESQETSSISATEENVYCELDEFAFDLPASVELDPVAVPESDKPNSEFSDSTNVYNLANPVDEHPNNEPDACKDEGNPWQTAEPQTSAVSEPAKPSDDQKKPEAQANGTDDQKMPGSEEDSPKLPTKLHGILHSSKHDESDNSLRSNKHVYFELEGPEEQTVIELDDFSENNIENPYSEI